MSVEVMYRLITIHALDPGTINTKIVIVNLFCADVGEYVRNYDYQW